MALETGTYVNSLNASNPASTDGLAQADDHLRLIKSTLLSTLPNVTGAITSSHTELNALTGVTASPAEINKLDGLTATTTQLNTLAGGAAVPTGGIIMWSGAVSAIPSGWVLCNGSNSTPDLRDRFVVGAGSTYAVNDTGGADSVALITANLPAHSHPFSATGTTNNAGAHVHSVSYPRGDANFQNGSGNAWWGAINASLNTGIAGDHSHTVSVSGTTGVTGSATPIENRPPYYALAYIMKT